MAETVGLKSVVAQHGQQGHGDLRAGASLVHCESWQHNNS